MGNSNSGRYSRRRTTTGMHSLDIRKIYKKTKLLDGEVLEFEWPSVRENSVNKAFIAVFNNVIEVLHNFTPLGERVPGKSYEISFESTQCHLGGVRWWWRCPKNGCNQRVAFLYTREGSTLACRRCLRLNYRSQRETLVNRKIRKLNKLRRRLQWPDGFLNGNGEKPPRMHWRTFDVLEQEHEELLKEIRGFLRW